MKIRYILPAVSAASLLALAGCGSSDTTAAAPSSSAASSSAASSSDTPSASSSSSSPAGTSTADLAVAQTSLGEVLVDGQGKTVYVFDKDAKGATASACTDQCATTWPAVVATAATPTGDGVDADLASITGVSGEPQVTVDGLPVYTFAKDTAPGDVMGQGVMGKWWVLSPTGEKITAS